jgi:hypothetical protein
MKSSTRLRLAKQVASLRRKLIRLHEQRRQMKKRDKQSRRALTPKQRRLVLAKTAGRCHICGGDLGREWQADHVRSHSHGGSHAEDNYLAAHPICNNYRRHYLPEEFHFIMKIGVWTRTQIEKGTPLGEEIAARFVTHERSRERRRVTGAGR